MRRSVLKSLFLIWLIFLVGFSTNLLAQENKIVVASRSEVSAAANEVAALASVLEENLLARIPVAEGWVCERSYQEEASRVAALRAVPMVLLKCSKGHQVLSANFVLEASHSKLLCDVIELKQMGIADGRVKPDLFRFFGNDTWSLMRVSVDLQGCYRDVLAFWASGSRDQYSLDAGFDLVDKFGEAIVELTIADIAKSETYAQHQDAMQRFVVLLKAQSDALANIIPSQGTNKKQEIRQHPSVSASQGSTILTIDLAVSPAASTTLNIDGCSVLIDLIAGELPIREKNWIGAGGADGRKTGAYLRINTDRFDGRERLDGTGIEVLADGRVVVRVIVSGGKPCESNPDIVRELFDQISQNDFSAFGID